MSEIWYDGFDQNCDGWNDYDQDQDTYVDENYNNNNGGTSPGRDDCIDTDATVNPGESEIPDDKDNEIRYCGYRYDLHFCFLKDDDDDYDALMMTSSSPVIPILLSRQRCLNFEETCFIGHFFDELTE